jgi:flagellar basal-body rod protein FlgB
MAIALFDLAEKRMAWADQRQQVLAHNIANANTPHWQAHDLVPFAAIMAKAHGDALAQTQAGHMSGVGGGAVGKEAIQKASEQAPDGNSVALDEQLTKVADTETTQELVTNLYKKYIGMFRTALGRQ